MFNFQEDPSSIDKTLLWTVPENLSYFEGHFPGNPVLPAVAVIDATVHALRTACSVKAELSGIPRAKFLGVIRPDEKIAITLRRETETSWFAEWDTLIPNNQKQKKAELLLEFSFKN